MAQQTKGETKPLFVYWGSREFKDTKNKTEMVSVSFYAEKGYEHPNYMSGFTSEVVENLHDESWDDLDEKAPITLTVERGGPNPKAKDGFYWNLLAIDHGHDSEYWPDGAPEEAQAPAPEEVQQAPADDDDMTKAIDRDELDAYINKESDDHGQYRMNDSDMKEFGAQLGNAANTASRIYSAYIASSEAVVEFNEDRFAELIVKNFKGIAKAKQTILNERSAR
jgi:hypothetical protein